MTVIEPLFGFDLTPALADAWRGLQRVTAGPTFLHDLEHVRAWLDHRGDGVKPLLLVARRDGAVAGIVPLMHADRRRKGLLPYRSVRFLADLDYAPLLAAPADAAEVVAAALAWLFESGWRWESLTLDNLVAGTPGAAAARAWLERRRVAHAAADGAYFHVDLARPWQEVMADTSRRFVRKNVNLAKNRLARAGGYEVEAVTGGDAQRVVATAAPLHAARQAQLRRPSFLAAPSGRAFLEKVVAHHAARGRFRAYWLRHGGRVIAYMIGFEEAGRYHAWNMAFDPAAAEYYPSRLLIHEILADCHARGVREFDFMRGEADYKLKWTSRFRPRQKLVVRNRATIYGRALHFLETAFAKPKEVVAR